MSAGDQAAAAAERREKRLAGWLSVICLVVVGSPVIHNWRDRPRDDFPLSYYPMFTAERADARTITHLVGIDEAGGEHILPYHLAGPGGMNQLRKQIRTRVRQGDARQLGRDVARRIAARGATWQDIAFVEVVTGVYSLGEYTASGAIKPMRREVHARVPVERTRS